MRVEFCRLATLYFAVRQVGHKIGNTRNSVFQLAMDTILELAGNAAPDNKLKKNVARITGPSETIFVQRSSVVEQLTYRTKPNLFTD